MVVVEMIVIVEVVDDWRDWSLERNQVVKGMSRVKYRRNQSESLGDMKKKSVAGEQIAVLVIEVKLKPYSPSTR